MYWLRGMFPADVASLAAEWGRVDTKTWPADVQERVAKAALEALDWDERRAARGLSSVETTRIWIEWSASHPTGQPRDLSPLRPEERAKYDQIARAHEGERFVEATLQIWHMPPPRSKGPLRVAHLTWQQIRELPGQERRNLAWARIGALCDAGSVDPIVRPVRRWEEIPEDDETGRVTWLVEDTWRDSLAPADPHWTGDGPPPLHPNRLNPDLAEELLTVVEHDFAERSMNSAAASPEPGQAEDEAVETPPPVIDLLSLTNLFGPDVRVDLAGMAGVDPFVRGIREFSWLLSAAPEYLSVALKRESEPGSMSPDVFAYNYIFVLQGGRDALLQMVPPDQMQLVEGRLQRAIDAVRKLIDAFRSRPLNQVVDRPNRRLFHGPWIPLFDEWRHTWNDVIRLISFWQVGWRGGSQGSPEVSTPPSAASHGAMAEGVIAHGDDFTWVKWFGKTHRFTKGIQSECVRVLWEQWVKSGKQSGCGLGEKAIGSKAGSSNDSFRLSHAFRGHEALGTMIRQVSKGVYALFAPESQQNPPS